MPAKKSNRTKKTRKMHAAKKLGKVKPLAVETSLLAPIMTVQPSSSSHTSQIDINSLSWGTSSGIGGVPGSSGSATVPDVSVLPGTIIKP